MFTLNGKVKVVGETEQITSSFQKRELVIVDESSQYPQYISLQAVQDKTSLLDGLNVGDIVSVQFFLNGREWVSPAGETRYFNSLGLFRIENHSNVQQEQKPSVAKPVAQQQNLIEEMDDDLPF